MAIICSSMCRLFRWCPKHLKHDPESLCITETTPNLPASYVITCALLAFNLLLCMLIHFSLGSVNDTSICSNMFLINWCFLACCLQNPCPLAMQFAQIHALTTITHKFRRTIWENWMLHCHTSLLQKMAVAITKMAANILLPCPPWPTVQYN